MVKRIDEKAGFVVVDCRDRSLHELGEIYQAFAMLCARGDVRFVLLKTGREDAEAHHTLRDILVTLGRVVETPLHFRLALLASCDAVEQVYRAMLLEVRSLGCDAQVFRAESEAGRWLLDVPAQPQPQPQAVLAAIA